MARGIVCHGLLEGPDKQHTRLQPPPAGGLVCQNVSCSGAGCRVRPESRRWVGEANNNRKLYPGWPVKQRQDIRCPNHSRRAKVLLLGMQTSKCMLCCSGTQTYNVCCEPPRDLATLSAFSLWLTPLWSGIAAAGFGASPMIPFGNACATVCGEAKVTCSDSALSLMLAMHTCAARASWDIVSKNYRYRDSFF